MKTHTRYGFSLIEMLVVIGLIGLLVGLTLPAVQAVRGAAARAACQNQLRQTGLGLHSYHDSHSRLPPGPVRGGNDPNLTLSWMGLILPYVDEGPLDAITTQAFARDGIAFHNPPHVGYSAVVKSWICPSDARLAQPLTDRFGVTAAYGSYLGISGDGWVPNGVLGPEPGIRLTAVSDGTSNTVMVAERPPPDSLQAGRWYTGSWSGAWGVVRGPDEKMGAMGFAPVDDLECSGRYPFRYGRADNPCDRYHFWSLHSGGANFLFADGATRFLNYRAADVLPALSTRAGGEPFLAID